jgi:uncharacterized protein (DUF486 family)
MTIAWYWHLQDRTLALWRAVLISWGIAFFEYCLTVPANRWGFTHGMGGFQLKIAQDVITLVVFTAFAQVYLKESFHWRYLIRFCFLVGAAYFMYKK